MKVKMQHLTNYVVKSINVDSARMLKRIQASSSREERIELEKDLIMLH